MGSDPDRSRALGRKTVNRTRSSVRGLDARRCGGERGASRLDGSFVDPRAPPVFGDVVPKFLDCVGVGVEVEVNDTVHIEQPIADHGRHSRASSGVANRRVASVDRADGALAHLHQRLLFGWMEIQDAAVRTD